MFRLHLTWRRRWTNPVRVKKVDSSGGSRISQRRGRQPQSGVPTYYLAIFQKTAWKWKNFGPGGATRPMRPLRSATGFYTFPHNLEVGPSQNPRGDIQINQAEQGGSECFFGGGGGWEGSDSDPPSSNVVIFLFHVLNSDPHLGSEKGCGSGIRSTCWDPITSSEIALKWDKHPDPD